MSDTNNEINIDNKLALRWLLAVVGAALVAMLIIRVLGPRNPPAPAPSPESDEITLGLDYGESEVQSQTLPWSEALTLLGLMEQAREDGTLPPFAYKGEGATALLEEIDGVRNEGGDGRHWLYYVNGNLAPEGFGVYQVQAGDDILWKFGRYE